MTSIRKRGNSYLLVVSMGYTPNGRRRNPQQKTVKPPTGLTPKQTEKWLQEQAMLFEMSCKKLNPDIDRSITLEKYTEIWLQTIAPDKLAKSTLVREKQAKDDYVFRRKGMELPMTPSTFTWRFKKILKANDLPTDLNVHSLRHTAASLFIASGTDVGTVAGLLGHSQPSTTLDIYTHAFDKNKKAASQIMQSVLEI